MKKSKVLHYLAHFFFPLHSPLPYSFWRLLESLRRTLERRPDLLEDRALDKEERRMLDGLRERPAEHAEDDRA